MEKNNKNIIMLLIIVIILLAVYIFGDKIFANNNNKNLESNNTNKVQTNTNEDRIPEEPQEFFETYLAPFQFCNGNSIVNTSNFKDYYNVFVGIYYISNYMDSNESTYRTDISPVDVENIIYKYFGEKVTEIPEYTKEPGFGVTKVVEGYTEPKYEIYWEGHGCGYSTYKIRKALYSGTTVTVTYDRYSPDKDMINTVNDAEKIFTLEYVNGNYIIKSIELKEFKK